MLELEKLPGKLGFRTHGGTLESCQVTLVKSYGLWVDEERLLFRLSLHGLLLDEAVGSALSLFVYDRLKFLHVSIHELILDSLIKRPSLTSLGHRASMKLQKLSVLTTDLDGAFRSQLDDSLLLN